LGRGHNIDLVVFEDSGDGDCVFVPMLILRGAIIGAWSDFGKEICEKIVVRRRGGVEKEETNDLRIFFFSRSAGGGIWQFEFWIWTADTPHHNFCESLFVWIIVGCDICAEDEYRVSGRSGGVYIPALLRQSLDDTSQHVISRGILRLRLECWTRLPAKNKNTCSVTIFVFRLSHRASFRPFLESRHLT